MSQTETEFLCMQELQAKLYKPPHPVYPAEPPGPRKFLRAARTNALLIWPTPRINATSFINRPLG